MMPADNNHAEEEGGAPDFDNIAQEALEAAERKNENLPPERGLDGFLYDELQNKFWQISDNRLLHDRSVCKIIHDSHWERIEVQNAAGEVRLKRVTPDKTIGRGGVRAVQTSTWWPGQPKVITGKKVLDGRIADAAPSEGERAIFNLYIPPPPAKGGCATRAGPWVEHVQKLWPNPEEHGFFFNYCAHMLQRPEEKCNSAIVLSGEQGIGKDAALVPVKMAVGNYNCSDIEPDALFARFRGFLQSLLIVVNEVRPAKDELHATSMYNLLKTLSAAPPEELAVEDKFASVRYIKNRCRVILTTNNYLALFIEPGDRRLMIMESFFKQGLQSADPEGANYFKRLFAWISEGGWQHVSAFLHARDLSQFDAQGSPPKTLAWRAVVASAQAPDDGVAFALDKLGKPPVVLSAELQWAVEGTDMQLSLERISGKAGKHLAHRMAAEGYAAVRSVRGDRWQWVQQGVPPVRSFLAFVNRDLASNEDRAVDAIHAHGATLLRERAARMLQGAVIPLRKGG